MNTIDNGKNFGTRLIALKTKFFDFTRKNAIGESKKREDVSRGNQDRVTPITQMSAGIENLVNEGPTEWAPRLKNIDNGLVPMHGSYVLRPRLSWTGVYGKEPWPRERKQWEKI